MINLNEEFPIASQTSANDKLALLKIRDILSASGPYKYLEVGSFLGGSLTPFLRDEKCMSVLSIDKREKLISDERGAKYDYKGITNQVMIDGINSKGIKTDKLMVFDGSVDKFETLEEKYDGAFIDGEHTDAACFRDFIYAERLLKKDCVIAFHDSTLIYKALNLICILLESKNSIYRFIKIKNSEVSVLFMGSYVENNLTGIFEAEDSMDDFYKRAEIYLLSSNISNRVSFNFSVKDSPAKKAY